MCAQVQGQSSGIHVTLLFFAYVDLFDLPNILSISINSSNMNAEVVVVIGNTGLRQE